MALGAHIHPYSYMYYAPHRDGVLQKVQVLLIPMGEGTSKAAKAVCVEPVVVILQEFSLIVSEVALLPSHENVS